MNLCNYLIVKVECSAGLSKIQLSVILKLENKMLYFIYPLNAFKASGLFLPSR